MNRVVRGVIAGTVGTVALDVATYADMVLRGRPASEAPAQLVGVLADRLGWLTIGTQATEQTAANRRRGLGTLAGYATGVGSGLAYGLVRGQTPGASLRLGGVVGAVAMAASDIPLALTGVSDPRTWSLTEWAADAIPHLIYGLITVETYEVLCR